MTANSRLEFRTGTTRLPAPDEPDYGDWIQAICERCGMPTIEAYKVRTCLAEAVNNIVEHSDARCVRITARPGDRAVVVEIASDASTLMPAFEANAASALPNPLAERGRGLAIIRAWMDDVRIERSGSEWVLRMAKCVATSD